LKKIALIIALFVTFASALSIDDISYNLQDSLQNKLSLSNPNASLIKQTYKASKNKPVWVTNKAKMSELIQALKNPMYNYKNKAFDQKAIKKLLYYLDNNAISSQKKALVYARLDLLLTNSYIRLIRFITQSDVDWQLVQKKLQALKEDEDISAVWEMHIKPMPKSKYIINSILNNQVISYLDSLIPMRDRYKKLVDMLVKYRKMDKFPKIAYSKRVLKLGDRDSRIINIKKRLQITGDYPKHIKPNSKFDVALQKAALTYQKRYLLKPTGKIDTTMIYYLNQPLTKNIQSIITNLDKTKLYPSSFENEYVEVNIPDFNLRYYKNHNMIDKMGVVVGRIDRPTPIFSNSIKYIVINPTWTIPDNLVKRDLIHVFRENPNYMLEHNIHVFRGKKEIEITADMIEGYEHSDEKIPYRFVQFPGDDNALGRVKFMFPNKYAVYLHDTDNKTLLTHRYKIYSSGCMRVDKPFRLLDLLLLHATKRYTHQEIQDIIATDKPKIIRLKKHIPIHILYFTVYQENGLAYFKNDIYMYDKIIQESIKGRSKPTFSMPKNRFITTD
jgi:murein L,D-transpeptidase YcbB/YkuD